MTLLNLILYACAVYTAASLICWAAKSWLNRETGEDETDGVE